MAGDHETPCTSSWLCLRKSINMNVGKAIKELRKTQNLNQVELAEMAGITQAALSAIENGVRPNPDTLKKAESVVECIRSPDICHGNG